MKKIFNVMVAGHRYSLEIEESDEAVMRAGAKALNEQMKELEKQKLKCTYFDYLAMAALMKSIECEELKLKQKYSSQTEELEDLADRVSRALED